MPKPERPDVAQHAFELGRRHAVNHAEVTGRLDRLRQRAASDYHDHGNESIPVGQGTDMRRHERRFTEYWVCGFVFGACEFDRAKGGPGQCVLSFEPYTHRDYAPLVVFRASQFPSGPCNIILSDGTTVECEGVYDAITLGICAAIKQERIWDA